MNTIGEKQNEPNQIRRLKTQRALYARAKTLFVWQVFVLVLLPIAWTAFVAIRPSARPWSSLWGIVFTLAEIPMLLTQKNLRERAARIQELFDCDVLDLPWKELKVGSRHEAEIVCHASETSSILATADAPLVDWYPDVIDLPEHTATLICQRANCLWDSELRDNYARHVIAFTVVIIIVMTVFQVAMKATLTGYLQSCWTLMPVIALGIKQYIDQHASASRNRALRAHSEQLWQAASDGTKTPEQIRIAERDLQNEIFDGRRNNPPVLDIFFSRLRKQMELQMVENARDLIDKDRKGA